MKQFQEIIRLWREDKKQYVKTSTISAYTLLIENHILPAFGKADRINEADVQEFVFEKLNSGLSQKSIKDILIVLKMILKFGVKNGYFEYTQIDIKFPTQRERQEIEVLSRSNHRKVISHIQENFTFRNLGIYICLCAGMRIGEICALKWEDIDTENGIISVKKTIQRVYMIEGEERYTELILDSLRPKTLLETFQ